LVLPVAVVVMVPSVEETTERGGEVKGGMIMAGIWVGAWWWVPGRGWMGRPEREESDSPGALSCDPVAAAM
jgi:hypothetical protein